MLGLVEWPSAPMRRACAMISFGRVAEAVFGEAHALRELAEEPDVGARFAGRLDGLLGELHEVVAVGALNVGVFEEGCGGENVVGVVGGVGEEQIMNHGEQVGRA